MEYLAIIGDPEHGNDIISLFESLGAKNIWGYKGKCDAWAYFMGAEDKILKAISKSDISGNPRFVTFDYDTFKGRYPLKVGDNICVPGDFDSGTVVGMAWNFKCRDMMYRIDVKGPSAPQGATGWWFAANLLFVPVTASGCYTCTVVGTAPAAKDDSVRDFGFAIRALKEGKKVTRKGWNGKGMYLWLKPASTVKAEWCKDPLLKRIATDNGGSVEALGTICMKTADNKVLTGWLASQTDMLSSDWMIV